MDMALQRLPWVECPLAVSGGKDLLPAILAALPPTDRCVAGAVCKDWNVVCKTLPPPYMVGEIILTDGGDILLWDISPCGSMLAASFEHTPYVRLWHLPSLTPIIHDASPLSTSSIVCFDRFSKSLQQLMCVGLGHLPDVTMLYVERSGTPLKLLSKFDVSAVADVVPCGDDSDSDDDVDYHWSGDGEWINATFNHAVMMTWDHRVALFAISQPVLSDDLHLSPCGYNFFLDPDHGLQRKFQAQNVRFSPSGGRVAVWGRLVDDSSDDSSNDPILYIYAMWNVEVGNAAATHGRWTFGNEVRFTTDAVWSLDSKRVAFVCFTRVVICEEDTLLSAEILH